MTVSQMSMNWSASRKREVTAQLGTVMAGALVLIATKTVAMHQSAPVENEPVRLTIVAPPEPKPQPRIEQPVRKVEPPKPVKTVRPQKAVAPAVVPSPVKSALPETPVAPVQKVAPIQSVAPVQRTVPDSPLPVQRASNGVAEGEFAQDVRSRIERKKIYPDTARDLGMSGEVEVTYELDRAGNLLRAEVTSSSGFKLLDQAALKAVKAAVYKRFPDDAWIGASSKVFRTKLVFSIDQ